MKKIKVVALIMTSLIMLVGCMPSKITEEERLALTTISDLESILDIDYEFYLEGCETFKSSLYSDGSKLLEYEFDSTLNELNQESIIITSEIDIYLSDTSANKSFQLGIEAYGIGAFTSKSKLVEFDIPKNEYDNLYIANQVYEDMIIGTIISVQVDNKIVNLIIGGTYFSDVESAMLTIEEVLNMSELENL